MPWGQTLRVDLPADSDDPALTAQYIREKIIGEIERLDVDHYFTPSGANTYDHADTAKHRQTTFVGVLLAHPTVAAGQAVLYCFGTPLELWWADANGHRQLTSVLKPYVLPADIVGLLTEAYIRLTNTGYLIGRNAADSGNVNLIRVNSSDKPELGASAQTSDSSAPTVDAGIANKKFVDDQILTVKFGTLLKVDSNSNTLAHTNVYKAQVNGFFGARLSSSSLELSLRIGATNPPTDQLAAWSGSLSAQQGGLPATPVSKDQYVQIYVSSGSGTITPWWQPFGAGAAAAVGLIKQ